MKSQILLTLTLMCALVLSVNCPKVSAENQYADGQNDGLALTPPMGWNSWNRFGCEDISEDVIKERLAYFEKEEAKILEEVEITATLH